MNTVDSNRVYCTDAMIKTVGRAVVVSLEDATLPGNARNKHMTALFRKHKKWTANEIESISRATDAWIKQKYGHNKAPVTFTIHHWGKQSVKIEGDLNALCLYLRSTFALMSHNKQRIPHCKLFVHQRHQKNQKRKKQHKNGTKRFKLKGKGRLERIISKIDELKQEKQREIELLNTEQQILRQLLMGADDVDDKALRNEMKSITKSFKIKRKELMKGKKRRRKTLMNDDHKEEEDVQFTLNDDEDVLYGVYDDSEQSSDQIEGAQDTNHTMDTGCTQFMQK